jgi:hypothetical protein
VNPIPNPDPNPNSTRSAVSPGGETEGKKRAKALAPGVSLLPRSREGLTPLRRVCFITAGPITKLFAWGEEESGGQVL